MSNSIDFILQIVALVFSILQRCMPKSIILDLLYVSFSHVFITFVYENIAVEY